jgi:hypothetical protein
MTNTGGSVSRLYWEQVINVNVLLLLLLSLLLLLKLLSLFLQYYYYSYYSDDDDDDDYYYHLLLLLLLLLLLEDRFYPTWPGFCSSLTIPTLGPSGVDRGRQVRRRAVPVFSGYHFFNICLSFDADWYTLRSLVVLPQMSKFLRDNPQESPYYPHIQR